MGLGGIAVMVGTAGLGFILADGLDRMIATYDPTATDKPKDKFTSNGSGTMGNVLNVAAPPGWKRLAASVGVTAVPAVGAMFVKNPYGRASLEGLAVGSGINLLKMVWNSFVMPMLVGKDTSDPALQKSYIARLYPAEVAAKISLKAQKGTDGKTPGPYQAAGALSGAPADVGPFALGGDSPYPNAQEALRRETGVRGDSPYPNAQEALRRSAAGVSGDSPYQNVEQALRRPGVGYEPGPPTSPGPGPQADASCGCVGNPTARFAAFLGDSQED